MMRPVDQLLARLKRLPGRGRRGWRTVCPFADGDREHVLKLDVDANGNVAIFCHNLCDTVEVVAAIGLRFCDLKPVRQVGRGRRGPPQSEAVKLQRAGLTDDQIRTVLARLRRG